MTDEELEEVNKEIDRVWNQWILDRAKLEAEFWNDRVRSGLIPGGAPWTS